LGGFLSSSSFSFRERSLIKKSVERIHTSPSPRTTPHYRESLIFFSLPVKPDIEHARSRGSAFALQLAACTLSLRSSPRPPSNCFLDFPQPLVFIALASRTLPLGSSVRSSSLLPDPRTYVHTFSPIESPVRARESKELMMHRIAEFRFVSFRDDRETLIAPATSRAASNNPTRPAFLLLKMHEAGFSTGMSGNAVPPFAYHFAVYAMVISGERPRRDLPFACHIAAERQPRPGELSQRTSHSPFLSLLLEYPPGINLGLRNSRFLFPTHRRTKLYSLNEIPRGGGNCCARVSVLESFAGV